MVFHDHDFKKHCSMVFQLIGFSNGFQLLRPFTRNQVSRRFSIFFRNSKHGQFVRSRSNQHNSIWIEFQVKYTLSLSLTNYCHEYSSIWFTHFLIHGKWSNDSYSEKIITFSWLSCELQIWINEKLQTLLFLFLTIFWPNKVGYYL